MNIENLKKAINGLNETQKTQLFEQITFSELNSRIIENNIRNKQEFSQQFFQELQREFESDVKNGKFNLAI